MKTKKYSVVSALITSMALLLAGCGSDADDSTLSAPAGAASLSGSSISFNPTINFTSTTNFSYSNNSGDDSSLPSAGGGNLTGTYTYTSSGRTAEMVLTFDDGSVTPNPLTLSLSRFQGNSSSISSFDVGFQGKSFSASVVGGTIAPAASTTSTDSSGSTGSSELGATTTLPDTVTGLDMTLPLRYKMDTAPQSFPYNINDTERFTISSTSQLHVGDAQRNLGLPSQSSGSDYEWLWYDSQNNFYFALSVNSQTGAFNEINVYGGPTGPYYGQFANE